MATRDNEIVAIVCNDDEIIEWPRLELARHCEYFRRLLYGNFTESTMKKIYLKHVKASTLTLLLNFYQLNFKRAKQFDDPLFSRILCEDACNAANIMQVADMLGMEEAVIECEKYFLQVIDLCDPADLFHLAFATSRFRIIREIMRVWLISCMKNRLNCCICEPEAKKTCVGCLYESIECNVTKSIHIVGGYYNGNINDCIRVSLNDFTKQQKNSLHLSEDDLSSQSKSQANSRYKYYAGYPGANSEEYRVVSFHTDIYLTGGYDVKARATNQVWKYDTRENEWSRVAGMRKPRFYHCIASIGQHIYVCGGFDDNYVLKTLERYHPYYNDWVDLCAMPTGVGNAAYASDETGIYVCCGQYGHKEFHTINSVQYYLVSTDQWSIVTAYESPVFYPQSEYGLSAAVVDNDFIVFGGQTARSDAFNFDTRKWRRLADMKCRRMETGSVVVGDKLYSVGGYDYRTGEYHNTVEQYDRNNDSWEIVDTRLPKQARSMGVCYIFDLDLKRLQNHATNSSSPVTTGSTVTGTN